VKSSFVSLRQGLPDALARALEAHFETDLARVRIGLNATVERRGALAFAQGNTIHLAPGAYRPESAWGQRLLAHELTHVLQQREGRVPGSGWIVDPTLEAEAEREAIRFQAGAGSALWAARRAARQSNPAVAQPRVKILHRGGSWIDAVVSAVSEAHKQSGSSRGLSRDDIVFGLMEVDLSPVDYGVVDLADPQHVELFYYQILRAAVGFQVRYRAPGSEALTTSKGDEKSELQRFEAMKVDEKKLGEAIELELKKLDGTYFSRIIAGAGSSASYYLNTLGPSYDHRGTLLIGTADAWTPAERGKGLINHESQNIAQWGRDAPKFSREYMARDEFAQQCREIRSRAAVNGMKHEWTSVTQIALSDKQGDPPFIVRAGGKAYTTNHVVVCLGAGPHVHPSKLAGFQIVGSPARLIDLDSFMRLFPPEAKGQKGVVVVHGPNAGIDAVERARAVGFEVLWFIRNTEPVLLEGNRLEHAPWTKTISVDQVKIGPGTSTHVAVAATFKQAPVDLGTTEVDYYVYALGQDPFAPGAVGNVLDAKILEQLEPVEDPNQAYQTYGVELPKDSKKSQPSDGTTADPSFKPTPLQRNEKGDPSYQSQTIEQFVARTALDLAKPDTYRDNSAAFKDLNVVVGLKLAGSSARTGGLWVLGAAAFQLVFEPQGYENKSDLAPYATVAKEFKARIEGKTQKKIDNRILVQAMLGQTRFEVRSVVISPQLGTVKSSIGALNGMMPAYISREANFSQDNPTMLRVYMASKYPNIELSRVDEIIAAILVHRRFDYHPLGYDAWWQTHWRHVLEYWNAKPEQRAVLEERQREELRGLQSKVEGSPGTQTFKD
jgi:hypothetical protein